MDWDFVGWHCEAPRADRRAGIQPDTLIPNPASSQSWNRFGYVGNNPIRFNDPSGHMCIENNKAGECYESGLTYYKKKIKKDYGVTLSNKGDKDWDLNNAILADKSLGKIDAALNGNLKSLATGWTFRLMEQKGEKEYHGVTHLNGANIIDFYTKGAATIRQMNIYHEVGHLLDESKGLVNYFTNHLNAMGPITDSSGTYLYGGYGVGDINARLTLIDPDKVYDPTYGTAAAIQHASTDPSEQWADMFANYVAGNIFTQNNAPGQMMQNTVLNLLVQSGAYRW